MKVKTPTRPTSPTSPTRPTLSDSAYQEIERLVTCTIDELVFLKKHAEDNQLDDTGNCSMTIGINIGRIEEILATAMEAA